MPHTYTNTATTTPENRSAFYESLRLLQDLPAKPQELLLLHCIYQQAQQMKHLARSLDWQSATLCQWGECLERRGWAQRLRPEGEDRRTVLLQITPAGARILEECTFKFAVAVLLQAKR